MNGLDWFNSKSKKQNLESNGSVERRLARCLSIYTVAKLFKNSIDEDRVSGNLKTSIIRMFLANKMDKDKDTVVKIDKEILKHNILVSPPA